MSEGAMGSLLLFAVLVVLPETSMALSSVASSNVWRQRRVLHAPYCGIVPPTNPVKTATRKNVSLLHMGGLYDTPPPVPPPDSDNETTSRAGAAEEERLEREQYEARIQDYLNGGPPDEQWLPTENPTPVNDEPWFTG
jgi:hypothetical protein